MEQMEQIDPGCECECECESQVDMVTSNTASPITKNLSNLRKRKRSSSTKDHSCCSIPVSTSSSVSTSTRTISIISGRGSSKQGENKNRIDRNEDRSSSTIMHDGVGPPCSYQYGNKYNHKHKYKNKIFRVATSMAIPILLMVGLLKSTTTTTSVSSFGLPLPFPLPSSSPSILPSTSLNTVNINANFISTNQQLRVHRRRRTGSCSSTSLFGIRGFRAWFESQFPDAMIAFDHPTTATATTEASPRRSKQNNKSTRKNNHQKKNSRLKSKSSHETTTTKTSTSTSTNEANENENENENSSESFHHVLIDINQLLHITLRRSKSDDHALILLLKELDKCLSIAKPTKSIVLAFDGPPAAAKLATQRRRRYGILVRNVRKKERMNMLIQKGLLLPTPASSSSSSMENTNKKGARHGKKMRKEEREELTLSITPGTKFMKRAEEAVLYWAWQRLSNLRGRLQIQNCRIYISSSISPGEGEVKLLDWLFQAGQFSSYDHSHVRNNKKPVIVKGESIAILGGDSDLVLEGLIIPPSITHNVFVILPSGNTRSYAVSLWETTLTLSRFLGSRFNTHDTMKIRTDLVLLLIMNGNDYLPKLRGSSGFNKLFHTYLYLLKKWLLLEESLSAKEGNGDAVPKPFFVNPNTLELNVPFCIAFFEALASIAPKYLAQQSDLIPFRRSQTHLSLLYSMVDSGLFPSPAVFTRIPFVSGKNEMAKDKEIMRLTLGRNNTRNDFRSEYSGAVTSSIMKKYYEFDIQHRVGRPLKKSKQLLANIALEELLGKDYMEISDYVVGNDVENEDIGDNDDDEGEVGLGSSGGVRYSWEMETAAACSVEEYLKGLIWNLATYQDGVCSDYGYNYGRRLSPTADEVLSYLKNAEEKGQRIGREELLSNNFTEPLSDGLSCLAALPTEVEHLLPKPYKKLSEDGLVEDIYASCMDKDTNVFDIELFKHKCMERVVQNEELNQNGAEKEPSMSDNRRGRKIRTGKTFWTVMRRVKQPLKHPFDPPKSFSDRLSQLRNDNKIKAFHMHAADRPRWLRNGIKHDKEDNKLESENETSKFTEMSAVISDSESLENVEFMRAFQGKKKKRKSQRQPDSFIDLPLIDDNDDAEYTNEMARMKKHSIDPPPSELERNIEGTNAIQCIQELYNTGALSKVRWSRKVPSDSKYASIDPELYEEVKLELKGNDFGFILLQDRNRNLFSRKIMKHHLASIALKKIFASSGQDWVTMSTSEMKSYLLSNNKTQFNLEGRNAIQCLHELKDPRNFLLAWEFTCNNCATEVVQLNLTPGTAQIRLSIKEVRDIYKTSKSIAKQNLAETALNRILGNEKDWRNMTVSEMRTHLKY